MVTWCVACKSKTVRFAGMVCQGCQTSLHVDNYNNDADLKARCLARSRVSKEKTRKKNLERFGNTASPSQNAAKKRHYLDTRETKNAKDQAMRSELRSVKQKLGGSLPTVVSNQIKRDHGLDMARSARGVTAHQEQKDALAREQAEMAEGTRDKFSPYAQARLTQYANLSRANKMAVRLNKVCIKLLCFYNSDAQYA